MQSSRELITNLLTGGPAERVGLCDGPWADTLRAWVEQGYPTDGDGKPIPPQEHFGYDIWSAGGWFDLAAIPGVREVIEETDEWVVTRNGAGAVFKNWKGKSGTPEHIDFDMTSRAVWEEKYRPHLLEPDPDRVDTEGARKALERARENEAFAIYGHMFIWECARGSMGDVCLYESMALDPEWIHDYARVYTDFFKAHFNLLFQEAGMPDGVRLYEDLGYHKGLFCSPQTFERLIFPYYAEMVEFFHERGLPVMLHTCGGVEEALPLIVEAGFDCLDPMERKAGNEPLAYADRYADRLAFMGGLDARVLESGDRERIEKEVVELIEGMKARGARYIFHSDHSLSTNVAYDDYLFALDIYRRHRAY
ncbi:MAG: uroporphyrinogen decarboxylase family protein [Candidatus Brocadiia bacterium]